MGGMYAVWPMGCAFNPLAITTTLLMGTLNTVLSISTIAEHGSLLTSSLIMAYQVHLLSTSMRARPSRWPVRPFVYILISHPCTDR